MADVKRDMTPQEKADAEKAKADAAAAQAAGVEMVTLTVDGVEVSVPKGTQVIEAAFNAGADVPYFCYHPRLESVGACRMCLANVELEQFGMRRAALMTTCNLQVQQGMVVKTDTPDVKKAQNGVLEFLLANHPLDCPICDRGGECPLQNMTIAYGPPTSRFIELKRHYVKALPISDNVVLDRERCITCMRCTRFADEIAGDGKIDLINRGSSSEIGPLAGKTFDSNFSGNTIEICPVGALTSRQFRFKGRPWELKSVDSVCSNCGNGCNIAIGHRLGEIVRINGRTNEAVNEEWTCDKGKFGHSYVNSKERLTKPLLKNMRGEFVEISWDEALRTLAERMKGIKASHGAGSLAAIGSTRATVEDNFLLVKLFQEILGTANVDHRLGSYPLWPMESSIAELEHAKTVISVGMDLPNDQPIVYLRVYKGVRRRKNTWLKAETLAEGLQKLTEGAVLLLPHNLTAAEYDLAKLMCEKASAKLNILLPDSNSWGAPEAGALPGEAGLDTGGILRAAVDGQVKLLYVLGSDPAVRYHDPALAQKALEKAELTVVQELFLTETAKRANLVLPAASFAEKDGTFVNIEGRHQKIQAAINPPGEARADWRILADLIARLGAPVPYFSARDIYREWQKKAAS
ncbi:MAG: NADH-quinone oxidoreductase subunit NuoG [Armatimonas sp.]